MASAVVAAALLVGSAQTLWAQATPAAPAPAAGAQAASPVIVVYRKALMNSNTQHMAALRALASGQTGLPEAELRDHVRRHAAALWENATLMSKGVVGNWDLFPRASTHATSRATPKIWQEGEGGVGVEFAWRIQAFEQTSNALLQLTPKGSVEQIREAVGRIQTTCGGCHASMRGPAPAATN